MAERLEKVPYESYKAYLKDKSRPPSKGGNTGAWHQHVLRVGGHTYSFLALGAAKWAYTGELVSFEWDWDPSRQYRNVKSETFLAWDKKGELIRRGDRGSKPWRVADARMPASRRDNATKFGTEPLAEDNA
jgi:hypothetical protein